MTQMPKILSHTNGTHIQDHNFFTSEAIKEAEATTPEAIASWIMEMMATFRDLSANQAKQRLQYMIELIFFMVANEKSNKVKFIHFITDFFIPAGKIDGDIEVKAIGFRGDFIGDQLPTMVQVTATAFKNIKR